MFTIEKFKPNSFCTSLHAIIIHGLSLKNCTSTDFLASPHEEGLRKEKAHQFVGNLYQYVDYDTAARI